MTTPGDDTPDRADDSGSAGPVRPARTARRSLQVLAVIAAVLVVVGIVTLVVGQSRTEANPLDSDTPALADFTMDPGGCRFEPDRGGLVAHFAVSTRDAGRFTVDVQAVTAEGLDDLDIPAAHIVRYTVPFYGGKSTQEFDVVVPLSEADHQAGYRKCRYVVNGTE